MIQILLDNPVIGLAPTALFFIFYIKTKWRPILIPTFMWFFYVIYEAGIKYGVFCSGECNVRADLIIILPLLAIVTLVSLVAFGLAHAIRQNNKH